MKKRNEYLDNIGENLVQYDAKLIAMKARIAGVHSDMKIEYLMQVDNIGDKRDDLMEKFRQLQETSGHGWHDIKLGTEKAWDDLEDSIEKANCRFK
jgi:dTDP-4-amino-4,6-dideoxygalactose transaminase